MSPPATSGSPLLPNARVIGHAHFPTIPLPEGTSLTVEIIKPSTSQQKTRHQTEHKKRPDEMQISTNENGLLHQAPVSIMFVSSSSYRKSTSFFVSLNDPAVNA